MLSQEQLDARKGKITSSVVAAILGLDKYTTPLQAWSKVMGEEQRKPGNEKAIERGNKLESLVLSYPCDVIPDLEYKPAPFRVHPQYSIFADSCDALYERSGKVAYIGEGKTASSGAAEEYGIEGTDEVPDRVMLQSQWHLLHWPETNVCLVPVLTGGHSFEFRLYQVHRDEKLIKTMVSELRQWYHDHIEAELPPRAQAGDTNWISNKLSQVHEGMWVDDSDEIQRLVHQKKEWEETKKHAAEKEEAAKNRLKMLIGSAEGVKASWGNVYYRRSKGRARTNWEALAKELGATEHDINKHTSVSDGARSLRIYVKEGAFDE